MRIQIFAGITFLFAFASCDAGTTDFSSIPDPHERWKAYRIESYSIDQKEMCYCVYGGITMRVFVNNGQIVDVRNLSTNASLPEARWSWFKSVDELFAFVKSINPDSVAYFRVTYDPKYGFPNSFWVDYSAQIADEEFGLDSENLIIR